MSKSVLNLLNHGRGQDVLIIAGGTSVKNFNFNKLKNVVYFGVNFQFLNRTKYGKNIKLKYQIYTDKAFADLSYFMDFKNITLIGHKPIRLNDSNLLSEKANYWFNSTILQTERDSCYYAIYICSKIMQFDNVYIIGLDGYSNGHIHYWDDMFIINDKKYEIQDVEKRMIKNIQFKKMIKYYNELSSLKNVYNLNKNSLIKTFPYRELI